MELTNKQKRFIEEYMIDLNAKQAAVRAGYSEKTATEQGSRLLTNVNVKAEVERLQAETTERLNINKESLIQDLLTIKDLYLYNSKATHNSIRAIEVINKMLGYNEPDKVENKITGINIKDLVSFEEDE